MSDQNPPQYPNYPSYPSYPGGDGDSAGYGQPAGYDPAAVESPYASWWSRVGAYLLDGLIAVVIMAVPVVIGAILAFASTDIDPVTEELRGDVNPTGVLLMVLGVVVGFVFDMWNRGVRLGKRGASIGKGILGLRVVRDQDSQFLGTGGGLLRWLMMFVLGLVGCIQLLDFLWPLWDRKNQTLHDKIVGSVVIRQ